jgi:hypothetical protein
MKAFTIVLFSVLLASCATFPVAYPKAQGRSLIHGQSGGGSTVFVRKVGEGELNFGPRYRLRDYAWVTPGEYDVSFMVESTYSWGATLKPAEIKLKVENGFNYIIMHDPARDSERKAFVTASKVKQ